MCTIDNHRTSNIVIHRHPKCPHDSLSHDLVSYQRLGVQIPKIVNSKMSFCPLYIILEVSSQIKIELCLLICTITFPFEHALVLSLHGSFSLAKCTSIYSHLPHVYLLSLLPHALSSSFSPLSPLVCIEIQTLDLFIPMVTLYI